MDCIGAQHLGQERDLHSPRTLRLSAIGSAIVAGADAVIDRIMEPVAGPFGQESWTHGSCPGPNHGETASTPLCAGQFSQSCGRPIDHGPMPSAGVKGGARGFLKTPRKSPAWCGGAIGIWRVSGSGRYRRTFRPRSRARPVVGEIRGGAQRPACRFSGCAYAQTKNIADTAREFPLVHRVGAADRSEYCPLVGGQR